MTEAFNTPDSLTPFPTLNSESDSPWSYKGRFGRLSYLAWSLISGLIITLFAGLFFAFFTPKDIMLNGVSHIFDHLGTGSIIFGGALYLALIYFGIIFGIRRLHDLNRTGWWMVLPHLATINKLLKFLSISSLPAVSGILAIISIIFWLYLIFAKGTDGSNHFGLQRLPPQWEKITGWIYIVLVAVIFVIGILAAIAIPAYMKHIKQAQETTSTSSYQSTQENSQSASTTSTH